MTKRQRTTVIAALRYAIAHVTGEVEDHEGETRRALEGQLRDFQRMHRELTGSEWAA